MIYREILARCKVLIEVNSVIKDQVFSELEENNNSTIEDRLLTWFEMRVSLL